MAANEKKPIEELTLLLTCRRHLSRETRNTQFDLKG
jgi:hypothetical protein